MGKRVPGVVSLAIFILLLLAVGVLGAQGDTERVSIGTDGAQGNSDSSEGSISGTGRIVAFQSGAGNLVDGDTNPGIDVFAHDRQTGNTVLVSVDSGGGQGSGRSVKPRVSANGRYVVFQSSTRLSAEDTNDWDDIYRHDLQTGETVLVSIALGSSASNGHSLLADVSADGRYVVFESDASNLIAADGNGRRDVFRRDIQSGVTERVSVGSGGVDADGDSRHAAVSATGRFVAFVSDASNLVHGEGNGVVHVYLRDMDLGSTHRVSVSSGGVAGNGDSGGPDVTPDGKQVVFYSFADNLIPSDTNGSVSDVFLHDTATGETVLVSKSSSGQQVMANSYGPRISDDGALVVFGSNGTLMGADDQWHIYVHDIATGATTQVSVSSGGAAGNGPSEWPDISADGRFVAFHSEATNLVANDTNNSTDVFVHHLPSRAAPSTSSTAPDATGTSSTTVPSGPTTPTTPPTDRDLVCVDAFSDDDGHVFEGDIDCVAAAGITRGCNPPNNTAFCPDDGVTRGQMAAFLVRALDLPPAAVSDFADTTGHLFEGDIARLAATGITRGCNPPVNDRFCPDEEVTRGQMAAFLARALHLPAAPSRGFVDTVGHLFADEVDRLAAAGITRGCNPPVNDRFCPDETVTRGQMAAFLNRALVGDG